MIKKVSSRHPFTILEMIVATGLLSVILFTLLSMLDISQKTMERGVSTLGVMDEARAVLDMIESHVTCVDYASYIEKNPENQSSTTNLADSVLFTTSRGNKLTVFTTQAGRLPRFCKVVYELDDNDLIMKVQRYNEQGHELEKPPSVERTLLTNVVSFKVNIEKYERLGDNAQYPKRVTIELELVDDDTRKLGYKNFKDAQEEVLQIEEIKKKIGEKAFRNRTYHFTRVVALEPPELQTVTINE